MNKSPIVILFNGPPGVGKTTIAMECAKQAASGAFSDVDEIRNFIKGGKVSARDPNKDPKGFEEQRLLAVDNVASMAKNFVNNGFNYFISDLVKIPSIINIYEERMKELNYYHVLLLPTLEENIRRDALRNETQIHGSEIIARNFEEFKMIASDKIVRIDTTGLSIGETIVTIKHTLKVDF